ncbi:gamma-glutamylcyclotransferase family protein [Thalassotalea sp. ND16A]|uniref:gamma-glutamylcyclotransferase family protein n=1 Tax=Thalassotalea sp. ND16A TaxID=1535422 RepID=UPI000519F52F|nr:gamma-glutamylcyclotransferase family protein [Thalassotalea sp. ND16A]KGJ89445.1 hypothetical protein ND16A_2338 [Thalassotalea sp. ND16A]
MKYFAYGSNMSVVRLKERAPSVDKIGVFMLKGHQLRFHKVGKDGSGKCDAYQTTNKDDKLFGALFEITEADKKVLDRVEGLGDGYEEKVVTVKNDSGDVFAALMYYATCTDPSLKPFSWYLNHVVVGAKETNVPAQYLELIQSTQSVDDPDPNRDAKQRAMYR